MASSGPTFCPPSSLISLDPISSTIGSGGPANIDLPLTKLIIVIIFIALRCRRTLVFVTTFPLLFVDYPSPWLVTRVRCRRSTGCPT